MVEDALQAGSAKPSEKDWRRRHIESVCRSRENVLDFGQNEKVFANATREPPLKLNKMNLAQCL